MPNIYPGSSMEAIEKPKRRGMLGLKHKPETIAKMSRAASNRKPMPAEVKERIAKSNLNKHQSEEARIKISAALTGRKVSPESVEKRRGIAYKKLVSIDGFKFRSIQEAANFFGISHGCLAGRIKAGYYNVVYENSPPIRKVKS